MNNNFYFVILAGGNSTRLWPISRQKKPKQLLAIGTKKTLLQQTLDRICNLAPQRNIWISTTKKHESNIKKHIGSHVGKIIVEPGLRNTAPAILLACMELKKIDNNASVIFLPSDHFISNKKKFVQCLQQAINLTLSNNRITLLGLKPTYPATGYGYIEFDNISRKTAPFPVKKFHEKPSFKLAKNYIAKNTMLWNIGIFCGKVQVFIQEFKTLAPEIYSGIKKYLAGQLDYNNVKSESIDYAIIEKNNNISVLPIDCPWCDVGNIEVFLTIQKEHNQLASEVCEVESKNNLVSVKNKLVALIGVDDLCIVETDYALLIIKKSQSEKVKNIVQQINFLNKKRYL